MKKASNGKMGSDNITGKDSARSTGRRGAAASGSKTASNARSALRQSRRAESNKANDRVVERERK